MQVVGVFAEVMLPVLLVAAVGGLAARRLAIPVKSLADLVFFVFSPALVFVSIAEIELAGGEIARIVAVVVTVFAANEDGVGQGLQIGVQRVELTGSGDDGQGVGEHGPEGAVVAASPPLEAHDGRCVEQRDPGCAGVGGDLLDVRREGFGERLRGVRGGCGGRHDVGDPALL
jgi:hypothetical protein